MFDSQLKIANEKRIKISKHKKVSDGKLEFTVKNSENGRKNFTVDISTTPVCSCTYFNKNRSKTVCSHIIFVVMIALDGQNLGNSLRSRYLADSELETLKSRQVGAHFLCKEGVKKTRRQFLNILQNNARYNDTQSVMLHRKVGHSADCRSCRACVRPGTMCFVLEGALSVIYKTDTARVQKFYFCAGPCLSSPPPPWTNIRVPSYFSASGDVTEQERRLVEDACFIPFQE